MVLDRHCSMVADAMKKCWWDSTVLAFPHHERLVLPQDPKADHRHASMAWIVISILSPLLVHADIGFVHNNT